MKILHRGYNTLNWRDATWDGISYYVGTEKVAISDIVSVRDAKKNQYVMCSCCKEIIRNTPSAIEKHKRRSLDENKCFECPHLRINEKEINSRRFVKGDDGKYSMVKKSECTLHCNYRYYSSQPIINTEDAKNICKYKSCNTASFDVVRDFFARFPGAFDTMVTVDAIVDKGYKRRHIVGQRSIYALKGRNQIDAYVNAQNIVTHFDVVYKNHCWRNLVYSPKYERLFMNDNRGNYIEWIPSRYDIPSETVTYIKSKIAELYN